MPPHNDRDGGDVAAYDRDLLVAVLVYHQRKDIKGCGCGWSVLGASYAEHVATVYEGAVAAEMTPDMVRESWERCRDSA